MRNMLFAMTNRTFLITGPITSGVDRVRR